MSTNKIRRRVWVAKMTTTIIKAAMEGAIKATTTDGAGEAQTITTKELAAIITSTVMEIAIMALEGIRTTTWEELATEATMRTTPPQTSCSITKEGSRAWAAAKSSFLPPKRVSAEVAEVGRVEASTRGGLCSNTWSTTRTEVATRKKKRVETGTAWTWR
jgi:copper homeostasis protein CutC